MSTRPAGSTPSSSSLTPGLLAILGLIAAVGPFSTDMYLASFTQIAHDLDTDPAAVQLTLTAFLFGLGSGQLVVGPLSDRWGRRPVLLAGLTVFAATGIALVFTPTITVFILLRFIQGASGAAGVALARAIVADRAQGADAVRGLSLLAMVVAIGPLVAPPLGGSLAVLFGWRGVLSALALVALAMLIAALTGVRESLPVEHRHTGGIPETFRRIGALLRDPALRGYVLAFAFGFGAMMAYISASPFVGQRVIGLSTLAYSIAFASGATALLASNLLNARIAPRIGPRRMLRAGTLLTALGATALTLLALIGGLVPATFIASAFVLCFGTGLIMANASALALARAEQARGSGSALLGAGQFLVGGAVSPLVGLWGEQTAVPMGAVTLICALIAVGSAWAADRVSRR